jgi:elongation factor G
MKPYTTTDIKNIALVGHGDSGKTSLAESLLFKTGATSRLGEVDAGTGIFDYEPDEKERKNSIDCALAYTSWQNKVINILDNPGYPDFIGEAIAALTAVETALVCINALSGIMVNTRKMWEQVTKHKLARAIVITKIDLDNVNYPELLQAIRETFGEHCLPFNIPLGSDGKMSGPGIDNVINLLLTPPDKIPATARDIAQSHKEKLVERIVESNDALLADYLGGKEIALNDLETNLIQAIRQGKIVPILTVSNNKQVGIEDLLNFIVKYLPSPAEVPARVGINPEATAKDAQTPLGEPSGKPPPEVKLEPKPEAAFSAQVFKCVSDPFVGKIALFRVFSGTINVDQSVYNSRTRKTERFSKLFKPMGKEQRPVTQAVAGDILNVTKIEDIAISDTLCAANTPIKYPALTFPQPMVALAVEPKSKSDEQRLSLALVKLADSDPVIKVTRDQQTNELVITGMSSLHLDIILGRLKRRYEVQVNTKPPKIPYKETVSIKAEGHHKHKKQTGGHGQYGEVYLRVEPLPRGSGFTFANEIFGGSIPGQYIPAVEKGVREQLEKGIIAGYPIVDIQVAVHDGSYHVVDSSEASFKIAASKALQNAFKNARAVLLEPIVNIEITIPTKYMGDITGDLNSRRGRIMGLDSIRDEQVIKAMVPLAEVVTYSSELRSITGGEGHYSIDFSHYEIVPQKIQEGIVARAKLPTEETDE